MKKRETVNIDIRMMDDDEYDRIAQRSPEEIKGFLKLAIEGFLENGNKQLLFLCIMKAIKWMGIAKVARQAKMTRQGLYTAFGRENANPRFDTLMSVLKVLGMQKNFISKYK